MNSALSRTISKRTLRRMPALCCLLLALAIPRALSAKIADPLPDAPLPQPPLHAAPPALPPCPVERYHHPEEAVPAKPPAAQPALQPPNCIPKPPPNWYVHFIDGPKRRPMTPGDKGWLATRNVVDPFNALTILGISAISVGSDSHSPYGPGMHGFAYSVGIAYTQDITGEFFGVFLIPSIVHQNPHYHRMPNASIPRRVGHAIAQVVWTMSDSNQGMPNYANLIGFAIEDEIGNLYVPGRQTNLPASAERYGVGLASAPIDNFVNEFLPDVARRVHIRNVLIQRLINQVAKTDAAGP